MRITAELVDHISGLSRLERAEKMQAGAVSIGKTNMGEFCHGFHIGDLLLRPGEKPLGSEPVARRRDGHQAHLRHRVPLRADRPRFLIGSDRPSGPGRGGFCWGCFVLSSGYYDAYYKKALQAKAVIRNAFARELAANPRSVEDYKGGKEKAFGFLAGQVMGELKGRANPRTVNAVLRELLES